MDGTATNNLFEGITAIEDAGGIDGFVREVAAESKTLGLKRAREQRVTCEDEAIEVFNQTLIDIVLRRLEPDATRLMEQAALDALAARDADAIATKADADAASEAARQAGEHMKRVANAVFEKIQKS